MEDLRVIVRELEAFIADYNREMDALDSPRMKRASIRVLGQSALLVAKNLEELGPLEATMDLDAIVDATPSLITELKRILARLSLDLDELSGEIWIPPEEEEYLPYYTSDTLEITYLAPFPALISKAVKAPEKNRILIKRALKCFGDELEIAIERYGGDLSFFKNE